MVQTIDQAQPSPLGRIFSMDEAAAALRISRRALQGLVKAHPHYAQNGLKKLFSEDDIRALWDAMRCPSSSPAGKDRPTGTSAAPSEDSLYSKARGLIGKKPPKRSASAGRARS